ncbi:hypothetical protein K443DRAFT_550687 [Laccaria amethystina LaAM-08-1]|uniref:Uncharacterized protein n=1 Tax=Laccaria amethystina LaAM-08-1 TaxID=1095629 RepID=A0A0C9XVT4_9AGAR|nr:hypothetical protein K443DRAFT_550687 [Laccaria amethystina LaAM-08-1]
MMTSVARLTLFLLISFAHIGLSAFTETTKSGKDYVEPNSAGTWCYYPAAKSNLDVACVGKQAEFLSVMDAHLAQGVSISYYGANNQRLGGAEYPVKTTSGKVYLCLSGRAGDGTYKTECELSTLDNRFGGSSPCALAVSQKTVTDGCYVPGGASAPAPSGGSTSSPLTSGTVSALWSALVHKSILLGLSLVFLLVVN